MSTVQKNRALLFGLIAIVTLSICATISAVRPEYEYYNGIVVVRGNEPFTVPIFVTAYGEFEIVGDLTQILVSDFQQRKIRIRGRVHAKLSTNVPFTPVLEVLEIVGTFVN